VPAVAFADAEPTSEPAEIAPVPSRRRRTNGAAS
jgi:hypothetical protein